MKTTIFRLEFHDDATSICDRLGWAESTRVLLAFPRRQPPHLNRLDLALIQRAATRQGAQLAIATLDAATIRLAGEVGIPVFSSIPQAQRLPWRTPAHKKHRGLKRPADRPDLADLRQGLNRPDEKPMPLWLRVIFFSLGVAGFMVIIFLFIPSAVVELSLPREEQTMTMTVWPVPGPGAASPGGQIPAATVNTMAEGQMEAVATGELDFPVTVAEVKVVLTNLTDHTVSVPAGTVLLASGTPSMRFLTRRQAELPAGKGQTIDVLARAEQPGSAGNVPAGAIDAVAGQLGLDILVSNPEAASGGADRRVRAASEADYNRLYDALLTSLTETAVKNLDAQYGAKLLLMPESIVVEQIVSETRQPAANAPADRVKLSMAVNFSILAVSRADLIAAAEPAMNAALPAGKIVQPDTYAFRPVNSPHQLPGGRWRWEILAFRQIVPEVEANSIFAAIKGQPVGEASRLLQNQLGLQQPPQIETSPSWWRRMPYLFFRAELAIQ